MSCCYPPSKFKINNMTHLKKMMVNEKDFHKSIVTALNKMSCNFFYMFRCD